MQTRLKMVPVTRLKKESSVMKGCIETLQQGRQFLLQISDDDYLQSAPPHVSSSIGGHFRHLLDLFYAISNRKETIDYSFRRRGGLVETSRNAAITELTALIDEISKLDVASLTLPVTISTEVCLSQGETSEMVSTLERELTFAALHATHHFAMATVVVGVLKIDINLDEEFGCAPTTVAYLRG